MSDPQTCTCPAELKIAPGHSSSLPRPPAARLPELELIARSGLTPPYKNTIGFSSEAEDAGVLLAR